MAGRRTEALRFCLPQRPSNHQEDCADMTRAQQTYERIKALEETGVEKADAFRQLADEFGQPVNSVRGAYYTGRREAEGDGGSSRPRRSRKRETTAEDAIETAIGSMLNSIENIEVEVLTAEERAREAVAEHRALVEAAGPRIAQIRTKIALLRGETPNTEGRAART